jgi:hypothetical protein
MSLKMVVIVTPEEIAEATINQDLIDLADTESGKATLEKYEKIVANKIRAKIDAEQFKNGDTYDIPEDLKIAAVSLIDNFYTYAIVEGQSAASKKVTSRKIDDFSEICLILCLDTFFFRKKSSLCKYLCIFEEKIEFSSCSPYEISKFHYTRTRRTLTQACRYCGMFQFAMPTFESVFGRMTRATARLGRGSFVFIGNRHCRASLW